MARGARALMDSAEPAYAPRGQDDAAWVRSVVAAVRPALDAGEGVLGWLYDARDTPHVRLSHLTQLGVRATVLEAFEQVAAHPATMTELMEPSDSTPAGAFGGSLGAHLDHHRPWHRNMVPAGVRDLVVVNALDDSHSVQHEETGVERGRGRAS
ncbi:hypothetical protein JY651_20480 [Pyxidicoccus parkwayensis]|uniref:Uncharacterized protein n=1 Tax=Pyxidicoccus parkwayensis TaxID=2813578 RepID=A0ABX7P9M4_9BACT|nr:hypothetical protein [Pyxidicoccus parkwaysis]QSQ27140.1 hypothetical protein JY651_20480 [Pyxidicoccus parkwaysis]